MAFCNKCGAEIPAGSSFCASCGNPVDNPNVPPKTLLVCPNCNSSNVSTQIFQEEVGETTISKSKSKYKQKGHGIVWWLCIGWWWWMIDLLMWICAFPIMLIAKLFKKKKYVGNTTSVAQTAKQINYKTVCTCGDCGHTWVKASLTSGSVATAKQISQQVSKQLKNSK